MTGRRHGAAGFRRGSRSRAGGPNLRTILGSKLRVEYDAAVYTSGTPPDVAAAPNLAISGFADLAQGTEASRPHVATDASGHAAWDFDGTDDSLQVTEASPILSAGDYPTIWAVARFGATEPNTIYSLNQAGFESTTGIWGPLRHSAGDTIATRIDSPLGTFQPTFNGFSGDTDLHLLRFHCTASQAEMLVNGYTPATVAGDANLADDVDKLFLGLATFGSWHMDGNILHSATARNLTTEELDAATNHLLARFGLTL